MNFHEGWYSRRVVRIYFAITSNARNETRCDIMSSDHEMENGIHLNENEDACFIQFAFDYICPTKLFNKFCLINNFSRCFIVDFSQEF